MVMRQFDTLLSGIIDSVLGLCCKYYGYQYSEIIRSLMCVYFCSCLKTHHGVKEPFATS